jgi:hypothetical protein
MAQSDFAQFLSYVNSGHFTMGSDIATTHVPLLVPVERSGQSCGTLPRMATPKGKHVISIADTDS